MIVRSSASRSHLRHPARRVLLVAALLASALPTVAHAQSQGEVIAELRAQIESLRVEQARSNQRIAELETTLEKVAATQASAPSAAPVLAASAGSPLPTAAAKPASPPRLAISGDIRVRYEGNFSDRDIPDRNRGVMRARLRASYAVNPWLTIGGQLATGDPNDPNTTDITLTRFDDKLTASLDQVYIRAKFGSLQIDAGKIGQPFTRTELVWDGDVSPQGISAAYAMSLGSGANLKATAMYFIVDEVAAGPDSGMLGGQLGFDYSPSRDLKLELAAGYYDYSLGSVAGGDAGDFRSNLFQNGRYVSDFNLLDVIAAVSWQGLGQKWPVRIVGDYVKNFGAATSQDSGFGVDLIVGRANKPHDWRFTYGYAQVDTDAVLAAYSHDNTNIATNYLQHTLAVDYTVNPNLLLNATLYHYTPKSRLNAGSNDPADWLNRFRLNAVVTF